VVWRFFFPKSSTNSAPFHSLFLLNASSTPTPSHELEQHSRYNGRLLT
jgi:hypothetical protein